MRLRAVIFDIGGVLKHMTNPGALRPWESRLGLAEGELRPLVYDGPLARLSSLGRATPAEVWQAANQRLCLSAADLAALQADMPRAFTWDTAMLAFIRSLRPGCKTAVLSNAWMDARLEMQDQINSDTFDVTVYSSEEGLLKPDPAIYLRTLARLGVAPGEAVFVDDVARNVDAAAALGMHGIVYVDAQSVCAEIERLLADEPAAHRFRAKLETDTPESKATYIIVPFDAAAVLGAGRRIAVRGEINGVVYRAALARYANHYFFGVNAALRARAGIQAGDEVDVTMQRDDEPRVIEPPADLAAALQANAGAQAAWDKLSYTHRREHVQAIEEAVKPETRQRRIERTLILLGQKGKN